VQRPTADRSFGRGAVTGTAEEQVECSCLAGRKRRTSRNEAGRGGRLPPLESNGDVSSQRCSLDRPNGRNGWASGDREEEERGASRGEAGEVVVIGAGVATSERVVEGWERRERENGWWEPSFP
jgi:hypothetical protein